MDAKEAYSRLWSKISNTRSACPDVTIGYVKDMMVSVLMEGLEGSEEERWVLARLSLGESTSSGLLWCWADRASSALETEHPGWDADEGLVDAYYEREAQVEVEARKAMGATLDRLIDEGRVLLRDGSLVLS